MPHPGLPLFPVVCLVGPTGAGKTAASLALCQQFTGTVINADSRQTYRDFPLITAQPSQEEQSVCPHRLYGFLPTEQSLGAGEYTRLCRPVIEDEHKRKRLPVLVGGTGLYVDALLKGVAEIPAIPDTIRAYWQQRLEAEGSPLLHALLAEIDLDYAAKIHPNDKQRTTRALEVWQATGHTFTWWHRQPVQPLPYRPIMLGVKRTLAELEPLLDKRIGLMLEAGALEEARKSREICDNPAAPGWSGIGCQEVYRYLTGELSLEECRALWLKNTRAYAKRQLTWFNANKDIQWFYPDDIQRMLRHVEKALAECGQ